MPKSYSFMVKYGFIWRASFNMSNPRMVHVPFTTGTAAIVGPQLSEAYDKYQPDLVVSVHPLMQVRLAELGGALASRQAVMAGQADWA